MREFFNKRLGLLIAFLLLFLLSGCSLGKKDSESLKADIKLTLPVEESKARVIPEMLSKEEAEEALEYVDKMSEITDKSAAAMSVWAKVTKKWPNLTDEDIADFMSAGDVIEEACEEVKKIIPPDVFALTHQEMLEGFKLHEETAPIARQGINEENPDLLTKAGKLLSQGTDKVKEASIEMKKISEELQIKCGED